MGQLQWEFGEYLSLLSCSSVVSAGICVQAGQDKFRFRLDWLEKKSKILQPAPTLS